MKRLNVQTAGRRRGRSLLGFAIATAMLATALVAPGAAFASDEAMPDFTVALVPQTGMNTAAFWEDYLAARHPGTMWDCTKVNSTADPVILPDGENVDALIIKAGTNFYGWDYPHAGSYSAPMNSTSHYYTCVDTTVEDIVVDPDGDIRGPCLDPAYFAVFDNTDSTVAVTFRFQWYTFKGLQTITKTVQAGDYFISWQKWVRAYQPMTIDYLDPETNEWKNLVAETSVKGNYPACTAESHGYVPGFHTGPVPADPSQS